MIQLISIIILILLFIWLQLKIYVNFWNKNLDVELKFTATDMFVGETGYLKEVITNNKWLPIPLFHVKFQTSRNLLFEDSKITQKTDQYYRNDVFGIGKKERITRTLSFMVEKRGCYRINSIDLLSGDLFMLTTLRESRECDEYIYVYPQPYYTREILHSLQMVNGLVNTKRQFLEDPFEYRGIREYQPFDDMKSINWKATAKTGDFKVNLLDFTAVKSVRIFLNLEDEGILKREDCAEVCIRIAAGIIKYFSGRGIKISCYGNCRDGRTKQILYFDEDYSLREIYRSLACVDLKEKINPFHTHFENRMFRQTNGEYTFILSMNAYDDFVQLLQRYSVVSEDFLWFYIKKEHKEEPDIPWNLKRFFKAIDMNQIR